jgi:hypothetical protein
MGSKMGGKMGGHLDDDEQPRDSGEVPVHEEGRCS